MIDPEQAEKIADTILERPRAELRAKRDKQAQRAEKRRRVMAYAVPALAAYCAGSLVGGFLESAVAGVATAAVAGPALSRIMSGK